MAKRTTRVRAARAARAQDSAPIFVMVHGGGIFPDDWYQPLVRAIERELGHPFAYLPVYYADVITRALARASETPQEWKFKNALEREFQKSFEAAPASPRRTRKRAARLAGLAPLEQFAGVAHELAAYFFNARVRTQIQERLIEKLAQAKDQQRPIILASLSLGTVVCFDVLKRLARQYPIALWFTTGSPIAKLRRVGRYDETLGAITPRTVARWYNIYDTTDWIADPLGPSFPRPGYRLHDIFVNVAGDPIGSHDYFNNCETIQMFADAIRTLTSSHEETNAQSNLV